MNLYEILEVPTDADVAAIEKAFRKLSRIFHPDKANISTIPTGRAETKAEKEARERRNNEKFAEITNARDILTDAKKRKEYDRQQRKNSRPSASSSSETKGHRSRGSRPRAGSSRTSDSRTSDSRTSDSRTSDSRSSGSRASDRRASDSRASGSRSSGSRLSRIIQLIDDLGDLFKAVSSIGDDLLEMSRELRRIGPRPVAFDRAYSDMTLSFHRAMAFNSTLVTLVMVTKDRLLDIHRPCGVSPEQLDLREHEGVQVLANTQDVVARGKQFVSLLRHAFADPIHPHAPTGVLFDRLHHTFARFPEQI